MQISYTFHISSKQNAITTTKQLSTASKHNLRKYSSPGNRSGHYDSDKTVQLAGTDNLFHDVRNVYREQFGKALEDYNLKQKREDRRIPDYMRYVSENAKSDLAVEAIIQLGDQEFWQDIPEYRKRQMTYIFRDQLNALRQYIPEFVIANAVIHFDEASPHMHVIGVPVATGYKRGMSKQCAKTKVFTKDTLEKLQDILRRRALEGMERNPEIFRHAALKPKEDGRNADYSKEYYIQRKREQLKEIKNQIAEEKLALSEIEEERTRARERLYHTSTGMALRQMKQELEEAKSRKRECEKEAQELEIKNAALANESASLHQQISELKQLRKSMRMMDSEVNLVWNVFDHFPRIKDFIFEIGKRLDEWIPFRLRDVIEIFKETVIGMRDPERSRDRDLIR